MTADRLFLERDLDVDALGQALRYEGGDQGTGYEFGGGDEGGRKHDEVFSWAEIENPGYLGRPGVRRMIWAFGGLHRRLKAAGLFRIVSIHGVPGDLGRDRVDDARVALIIHMVPSHHLRRQIGHIGALDLTGAGGNVRRRWLDRSGRLGACAMGGLALYLEHAAEGGFAS